jgi:hypothetical protein
MCSDTLHMQVNTEQLSSNQQVRTSKANNLTKQTAVVAANTTWVAKGTRRKAYKQTCSHRADTACNGMLQTHTIWPVGTFLCP